MATKVEKPQIDVTIYRLELAGNKIQTHKMKADQVFSAASNIGADTHIVLMTDNSFGKEQDIGTANKLYQSLGCNKLPWHFLIPVGSKEIDVYDGSGYQTKIPLKAGTPIQIRDLNEVNEVNDPSSDFATLWGGKNAVTICLMGSAEQWITGGAEGSELHDLESGLSGLCLLLFQLLGVNTAYLHNWQNPFVLDKNGNPCPSIYTDSFDAFWKACDAKISEYSDKFSVYDPGGNSLTYTLIIPKLGPFNSNLTAIARLCGPDNATKDIIKKWCEDIIQLNRNVFPDGPYVESEYTKFLPWGTELLVPKGSAIGKKIEIGLKNENSIFANWNTNMITMKVETVFHQDYQKLIQEEWKDPSNVHHTGDDQIYLNTRGGKSEMAWRYQDMQFPGYHNCLLQFNKRNTDEEPIMINFLVSPSSVNETRANRVNDTKTLGGWVGVHLGRDPIHINFQGVMLDIRSNLERHRFLENYKNLMESAKGSNHAYYNDYNCKLIIEGRDYYGYVSGLNFSKRGESPYVYNYTIEFTAYNDKEIYDPSWALVYGYETQRNKGTKVGEDMHLNRYGLDDGEDAYSEFMKLLEEGWAGEPGDPAYDEIKKQIENASADDMDALVSYWTRVLQGMRDSQDWSKTYLMRLVNNGVISNIDIWENPDVIPTLANSVALFDKMTGGTWQSKRADDKRGWYQPNLISLMGKGVIVDGSKNNQRETYRYWMNTNTDTPSFSQSKLAAKADFLALCDHIGGSTDLNWVWELDAGSVKTELSVLGITEFYTNSSGRLQGGYWNLLSLYKKGVLDKPIDGYWNTDLEGTIDNRYALALAVKAYDRSTVSRPIPDFAGPIAGPR